MELEETAFLVYAVPPLEDELCSYQLSRLSYPPPVTCLLGWDLLNSYVSL